LSSPRLPSRCRECDNLPSFSVKVNVTASLDSSPAVSISVTLTDLPSSVAEEIAEIQQNDPDMLKRIVTYGITRTVIFETLVENLSPVRV
jgi:hypothetical protein